MSEVQVGARPVVTEGGLILCYSCFQGQDDDLDYWMPYQVENFPCVCDLCGLTMKHEAEP